MIISNIAIDINLEINIVNSTKFVELIAPSTIRHSDDNVKFYPKINKKAGYRERERERGRERERERERERLMYMDNFKHFAKKWAGNRNARN